METYYIYKATNKIDGKSYIGMTNQFRIRVWQHMRCYEKEDCVFHRAIQEFGIDNFTWDILKTTQSEHYAEELEKHYIEFFNSYIPNGYNMNKGGVGGHNARAVVCLTFNGEFVKRYDSAADAEKQDGFCNSDVLLSCKNVCRTCRNHIFMFEDEYIKYGARKYRKPESTSMKTIIQCDANGSFIRKFRSVVEAARETGIGRPRISSVLIGNSKHANGCIFVYEDDFPIKDIDKYSTKKKGRKIAQVNANTGEIIKVFNRISEAGEELQVNYKAIHKVLDLPGRTAYGYKWISQ